MKQRVPVKGGLVLQGSVLEVLAELPDESFHSGVTSPAYWKLRDYQCEGQMGQEPLHDCGAWAIGNEPCDLCYVCGLRKVFREIWRVLRRDGVFMLNLGDSYNGSGGAGGDYSKGGLRAGQPKYGGRNVGSLKQKDMALVPERVALALQADGWWVRNLVIWYKSNGMPSSAQDRFSTDFEHVWVLTRSRFYFFDQDAVKVPYTKPMNRWGGEKLTAKGESARDKGTGQSTYRDRDFRPDPEGRTRRSVWKIPTKSCDWDYCYGCCSLFQNRARKRIIRDGEERECPNCGSRECWVGHFAAFPPALVEPCIKATTSEKGCCETCGSPMVRRSKGTHKKQKKKLPDGCLLVYDAWSPSCSCINKKIVDGVFVGFETVPCRVLDPFAGSGTVGVVSKGLGRVFLGIDLKPEYVAVANARIVES